MKRIKIGIGFLLIFGAANEYVAASRQLGTLFSPGVMAGTLLILIFSFWLIASGFSDRKYHLKPINVLKYFIITLVTFTLVMLYNLGSDPTPTNFVVINGIRVPLGECINGSIKSIPDLKDRHYFCECFVEKITNDPELKSKFQSKLEHNKVGEVFTEIQNSPKFLELGIEDCMSSIQFEWTDVIVEEMKQTWKNELSSSEFEITNDIDKYCDCLADEYRKYPIERIMEDNFYESELAVRLDKKCSENTLKPQFDIRKKN